MPTTRCDAASPPAAAPLARIAFALLVLATLAALLIAQHLKHEEALVQAPVWSPTTPTSAGQTTERFSFRAYYDDNVTVSIVSDATGRAVAVVGRDVAVRRYRRSREFTWHGELAGGAPAAAGRYSVDVHFDARDRTVPIPGLTFTLKD